MSGNRASMEPMNETKPGMKRLELGPTARHVARAVRELRAQRQMTYAQLSRELAQNGHELAPLAIRRIEAEARRVDSDDLVALAAALRVSPLALVAPGDVAADELVEATGVPSIDAEHLWAWLTGSVGLSPFDAAHVGFPAWMTSTDTHEEPLVENAQLLVSDRMRELEQRLAQLEQATGAGGGERAE